MGKKTVTFVAGTLALAVVGAIAFVVDPVSSVQREVLRFLLAFGAGAMCTILVGEFAVSLPWGLRAAGPLAVFAAVYFFGLRPPETAPPAMRLAETYARGLVPPGVDAAPVVYIGSLASNAQVDLVEGAHWSIPTDRTFELNADDANSLDHLLISKTSLKWRAKDTSPGRESPVEMILALGNLGSQHEITVSVRLPAGRTLTIQTPKETHSLVGLGEQPVTATLRVR